MTSYGEARLTASPRANLVDDLTTVSGTSTEIARLLESYLHNQALDVSQRRRYVLRDLLQINHTRV